VRTNVGLNGSNRKVQNRRITYTVQNTRRKKDIFRHAYNNTQYIKYKKDFSFGFYFIRMVYFPHTGYRFISFGFSTDSFFIFFFTLSDTIQFFFGRFHRSPLPQGRCRAIEHAFSLKWTDIFICSPRGRNSWRVRVYWSQGPITQACVRRRQGGQRNSPQKGWTKWKLIKFELK